MPRAQKPKPEKEHATHATVQQRVTEVLRLRLAGAQWQDLLEFAYAPEVDGREGGPWNVGETQIREYVRKSNELLAEQAKATRDEIFQLHIARRESLYARCIDKGDERTALAILRDMAELCGLYDSEAIKGLEVAIEELRKRLDEPETQKPARK